MRNPGNNRKPSQTSPFFKWALVSIIIISDGASIFVLGWLSYYALRYLFTAENASLWVLVLLAFYGLLLSEVVRSTHRFLLKFAGTFPDGGLLFFLPKHRAHRQKSMR